MPRRVTLQENSAWCAPLYSLTLIRSMLSIQLVALVSIVVLFYVFRGNAWSISALAGGMAAWLPNVVFMILARILQNQAPVKGRIAWTFALSEACKVLLTILLLVSALVGFDVVFMPLGLAWLSVLIVQIIAPTVINNKR